jgi:hypothetical protein
VGGSGEGGETLNDNQKQAASFLSQEGWTKDKSSKGGFPVYKKGDVTIKVKSGVLSIHNHKLGTYAKGGGMDISVKKLSQAAALAKDIAGKTTSGSPKPDPLTPRPMGHTPGYTSAHLNAGVPSATYEDLTNVQRTVIDKLVKAGWSATMYQPLGGIRLAKLANGQVITAALHYGGQVEFEAKLDNSYAQHSTNVSSEAQILKTADAFISKAAGNTKNDSGLAQHIKEASESKPSSSYTPKPGVSQDDTKSTSIGTVSKGSPLYMSSHSAFGKAVKNWKSGDQSEIRKSTLDYVNNNKDASTITNEYAQAVMKATAAAPKIDYPIYRRMTLNDTQLRRWSEYATHDSVKLAPLGYSKEGKFGTNRNTLMILDSGSHAVDITHGPGGYENEQEHLTAGHYKITSAKWEASSNKHDDGAFKFVIRLKQLGKFDPDDWKGKW